MTIEDFIRRKWRSIMNRMRVSSVKRANYAGVMVAPEFQDFSQFKSWAEKQFGVGLSGWQIDKDILQPGNRVYGPDKCIFVPPEVNILLTNSRKARGKWPLGVIQEKEGNFRAACSIDGKQIQVYGFKTPESAFEEYKRIKEANIRRLAEKFKSTIDPRAYAALMAYEVKITD